MTREVRRRFAPGRFRLLFVVLVGLALASCGMVQPGRRQALDCVGGAHRPSVGGAIAVPLSADGWKFPPLGLPPLGLGVALLLAARSKAQGAA